MSVAQVSLAGDARPIGTGFLVGSGRYLVTANHVVEAAAGAPLQAGLAGVDHKDKDIELRAAFVHISLALIAVDARNDVAVLEVLMPPDATSVELSVEADGRRYSNGRTAPMKFSGLPVQDGNEIAISGFPLSAAALVTTRGIVASMFAPHDIAKPDPTVSYLCDVTAIHGNSGGPVYRASDGSVIGLCRAVQLANVGGGNYTVPLTVVTPAEHIIALLRSEGIDPGAAAQVKPPTPTRKRR